MSLKEREKKRKKKRVMSRGIHHTRLAGTVSVTVWSNVSGLAEAVTVTCRGGVNANAIGGVQLSSMKGGERRHMDRLCLLTWTATAVDEAPWVPEGSTFKGK
jgi:hypothetical protein